MCFRTNTEALSRKFDPTCVRSRTNSANPALFAYRATLQPMLRIKILLRQHSEGAFMQYHATIQSNSVQMHVVFSGLEPTPSVNEALESLLAQLNLTLQILRVLP